MPVPKVAVDLLISFAKGDQIGRIKLKFWVGMKWKFVMYFDLLGPFTNGTFGVFGEMRLSDLWPFRAALFALFFVFLVF